MRALSPQQYKGSSKTLVQSVILGRMLSSRSYIKDAVPLCLVMLFPESSLQRVAQHRDFPQFSSAMRASATLDIDLMLLRRQEASLGGLRRVRFGWADSSPQCGRKCL